MRDEDETQKFLSFAYLIKDEPVVIIDVRSNRGGNAAIPIMWFKNLLGENVPSNYIAFSVLNDEIYRELIGPPFSTEYTVLRSLRNTTRFDENHRIANHPPDRVVGNERLTIILADRFTQSAAELMVDLTFNMENTLFIGQNTAGFAQTSLPSWYYRLPSSGIPFQFGVSVNVFPEGHFREGIGIAPDIWVHGDALAAALGMLERHVIGTTR
jgi:C-terminal processing protease CtpA/Prc